MNALIGNEVKTAHSDYAFSNREQAEAFYMAMREREARRAQEREPDARMPRSGSSRKPLT